MRLVLSIDFEDEADIDSFLAFVKFHRARLKCSSKDVFLKLASEWQKQREVEIVNLERPSSSPRTPTAKKPRATKENSKGSEESPT